MSQVCYELVDHQVQHGLPLLSQTVCSYIFHIVSSSSYSSVGRSINCKTILPWLLPEVNMAQILLGFAAEYLSLWHGGFTLIVFFMSACVVKRNVNLIVPNNVTTTEYI